MKENFNQLLRRMTNTIEGRNSTIPFLEKYWLSEEDYQNQWQNKVNIILPQILEFDNMIINPSYHKLIALGPNMLIKDSMLNCFYQIMRIVGDTHFLVLEIDDTVPTSKLIQLKIPIDTLSEELVHHSGISDDLLVWTKREYLLMGDCGDWCMRTTWDNPDEFVLALNLYIYRPYLEALFHDLFRESELDRELMKDHVTERYWDYL